MLAVVLACAEPAPEETRPDPLSADALEAATRALTELGPRMVATSAEPAAADVVVDLFRSAGLEPERAPFVWDPWLPLAARVAAGDGDWEAEPLSPSEPTDGIAAPISDGPSEDAIALVSSDDGSRAEQFFQSIAASAAAMVRVTEDTDDDGAQLVEVGHTLAGTSFRSVAVGRDVGLELRDRIGEEAIVSIESEVVAGHTSENVLARIEGDGSGTVFVVAHYDSWHQCESAFDNALGVAMLTGLAADLAAGPAPFADVVFLATSGEEQGLVGSSQWVEENESEAAAGDLVLVLDVPWSGEGRYLVTASDSTWAAEAMDAAADLDPVDSGEPSPASDHVPFVSRGVPAVWMTRQPDRRYHTHRDLAGNLDFEEAAAVAKANAAVLRRAAGVDGP